MSKIFKIVMDVVLILMIFVLVLYFILRIAGLITIFRVETGSMEKSIHTGDYIMIVKSNNLRKGDVVTYKQEGYYVTHRIVKIEKDKIITKGDANNTEDKEIEVKDVIGKVVMKGKLLNFIVDYKFAISGVLISLYLFSCYFNSRKKKTIEE